jgi:metal-responsive CopG/Arc/MetJ family transcriptional regulator
MSKSVKINITLPEEVLKEIDEFTREGNATRSGLILDALRAFVARREDEAEEEARRANIRKAVSGIRQLKKRSGNWDGVAEIRKWRDAK